MTDRRHQPYSMQSPPETDSLEELRRYLNDEFRRVEMAQNGVDLDVETRWGNISIPGSSGVAKLPPAFKQYSTVKPSLTILFPDSAVAGTTLVFTLNSRIINIDSTAVAFTSVDLTVTARPNYCRRIEFPDITASGAAIDAYVDLAATAVNQDYAATAPSALSLDVRIELDSFGSEQPYSKDT